MSTYTSTLQKRKTSKTKSKHAGGAASEAATDGGVATSTSSSSAQNERLQRGRIGDKLDVIRKQQQLLQQQLDARNLCNGITAAAAANVGVNVSCCRDINCRLNATSCPTLRSSFARELSTASTSSSIASSATAPLISASRASTATCASNNSRRQTTTTPTSAETLRDSSPDSGMGGSDGGGGCNGGSGVINPFVSSLHAFDGKFTISLRFDLFTWLLFAVAFCTRFYRLATPRNVVFDELHYGKFISLYMRNVFFFDQHPPLGKQLIAGVATLAGYDGNYTFPHIGAEYTANVPIFWLRFVPALCGSLLSPAVYKLLLELRLNRWTSLLGGLLIIFDNALLTQSRFVLMEPMLLLFCTLGIYYLMKFQRFRFGSPLWLICGLAAASFLTFAASVKYIGVLSGCLAAYLMCRYLWDLLYDATVSDFQVVLQTLARILLFVGLPFAIYMGVFYVHLETLHRAGPHDSVMTSAFQASLEGGLASITKGQPLQVVHGSQITLRHTHGRTCWLHSHPHVYPVRYPDKRGSSHQQQVTCYSFKDVNNWWIVKRPERDELVVGDEPDVIRHGDVIQLVHGITSRALNSHDVAAPVTPQCQEVSCYIDYEIQMEGQLLWRVEILNKDAVGPIWHAIKSQVRLIHQTTGSALRFSGRQLPDWGFNQHEVVADRVVDQKDTIWNVEEHRYTKTQDQRERERQMLNAEMIPTKQTRLSFWEKFLELQAKMLWNTKSAENHMYSSSPHEWPLMDKGIAYWVDNESNGQIHLLGNILIWYTGTLGLLVYAALLIFYVLRRRRLCYDLTPSEWHRFLQAGDVFFVGYLIHYVPYFFVDRTLFLHNYFPALLFKLLLLCFVVEHVDLLLRRNCGHALWWVRSYRLAVIIWLIAVVAIFRKFLALSYGVDKLSAEEVTSLRWKDTWDFILRKDHKLHMDI